MSLGASPHPIPNLPSNNGRIIRNISSIVDVGNLDPANGSIAVCSVPMHHDVIWLDIRMHDAFLVQCRNASERVPQYSFYRGKRHVFLGERKEMILEVYVGKHGLIRNCVFGHADVGRTSKVVGHGLKVLEVVI